MRRRGICFCVLVAIAWTAAAKAPARLGIIAYPPDLAAELRAEEKGAAVYVVIPTSAAGKARILPGDVITRLDDAPIQSFSQLGAVMSGLRSGQKVKVSLLRDGRPLAVDVTLSTLVGEPTPDAYKAAAKHLKAIAKAQSSAVIIRELVNLLWSAGERRQAVDELADGIKRYPKDMSFQRRRLELLTKTGDYDGFCQASLDLAEKNPNSSEAKLMKVEALIALGRNAEAEPIAAEIARGRGLFGAPSETSIEAAKKWVTARMRQGKSLSGGPIGSGVVHPELAVMDYWRKQMGDKPTYAPSGAKASAQLPLQRSGVLMGLAPYAMHGITVKLNGTEVPLAIIDTGASHTLISTQSANAAKIKIGGVTRSAAGSLAFTARPAIVDELDIAGVKLANLPVSVGNPPPLVMTKAKLAIGVDVMHHLRFTIDYPASKVEVERASTPLPEVPPDEAWDIPLWTFTDHCLSQAKLGKSFVRTLVDSGNFAATLVWPEWAKANIPNHPGQMSSMLAYAFTNPQRTIPGLELGGRKLPDWPALDMPPVTLQGIDLLDLLMGHDLLSQYRVTIDMPGRRLRLRSPGAKVAPPAAPKPLVN